MINGFQIILPIIIYILLIIFLVIGIILGIRSIQVINKVERAADDFNDKMRTLDSLFSIIDFTTDKIASITDKIVEGIIGITGKIFSRNKEKNNIEKEEEEI